MESPPGEEAVKIAKITTRDVQYHNLVDRAAAGCERTDSDSERSPTVGKMPSNTTQKLFMRESIDSPNLAVVLRN